MSIRFNNPFENLPKEVEKKLVGKKALWESVKPTDKLAKIIKRDDPESEPQMASQLIPDKYGRTIDGSLIAEEKITAIGTSEDKKHLNSRKIDVLLPQPKDPDAEYLKGRMSKTTDEARKEKQKRDNIGKAYA